MIVEAYIQDSRALSDNVNNVRGRSARKAGLASWQSYRVVCKECENRIRFLGGLETKMVGGTEFGSRLWVKTKIVDEVGECKRS